MGGTVDDCKKPCPARATCYIERVTRRGLVTATIALAAASGAAAKGWPTPAAGDSASGGPEILFTFDDGPNLKTTPLVLDTLARHHIHAVFFLVGEMAENKNPRVPALIHRILREGH